jgi:hypothetical protein
MVGQMLFTNCVAGDAYAHAELSLQIIIVTLKNMYSKLPVERASSNMDRLISDTVTASPLPPELHNDASDGKVVTLWDLLVACYNTGLRRQPALDTEETLCKHVELVVMALHLINVFTRNIDMGYIQSMALADLLSTDIRALCPRDTLRRREPIYPAKAVKNEFFGKKELSVTRLRDIGALNILWTRGIDEYFILDTQHIELRIFWPIWSLANLPCLR